MPELGVELGGDEARAQARRAPARRSSRSGRCAARPPARRGGARARQTAWLPPRAAVDQEPAAPRAPGLGGEPLGERERGLGGSGPTSMPSIRAGMSSCERRLADASRSAGSAPGPPLWPGTWKRPGSRAAYSISASRYGRRVLVHGRPRRRSRGAIRPWRRRARRRGASRARELRGRRCYPCARPPMDDDLPRSTRPQHSPADPSDVTGVLCPRPADRCSCCRSTASSSRPSSRSCAPARAGSRRSPRRARPAPSRPSSRSRRSTSTCPPARSGSRWPRSGSASSASRRSPTLIEPRSATVDRRRPAIAFAIAFAARDLAAHHGRRAGAEDARDHQRRARRARLARPAAALVPR